MPDREDSSKPLKRTGGRSAKVLAAAQAAAAAILLEEGYDALGHRQVAAAAGISDMTVYRRWPTKSQLVQAAMEHLSATAIPMPDHGSFRKDLAVLVDALIAYLGRPDVARMARGLVAAQTDQPDDAAARDAFWKIRFSGAAQLVERAIARSEIAAGTNPMDVIETFSAPIHFRVLVTRAPLDRALRDRVIRDTLRLYLLNQPGG